MDIDEEAIALAHWQPVVRNRTYELVIEAIEDQIMTGSLTVGDALPPERELASKLGVSRPAVREAFRVLEGQGVLRSVVGGGPSAGTFVAALPGEALTRFLRLHLALANFKVADVIEARVTLESSSVALAAQNPQADAMGKVRRAMDEMSAQDDRRAFNAADTAFHSAIADASGNGLVRDMTVAIRNAMRGPILEALEAADDWPALRETLLEEHRAILDAIESGDTVKAAAVSEKHIREAYDRLPSLHSASI